MDKTTAQRIVRETFKAPFDKGRYRNFINELCNGFDESKAQPMSLVEAFKPHVKSCQRLGTFESPEGELTDVELAAALTQGFGMFGVGLCLDTEGRDRYLRSIYRHLRDLS